MGNRRSKAFSLAFVGLLATWALLLATLATGPAHAASTDITWSAGSTPVTSDWLGVAYGNGVFVAVADNGSTRAMRSTDGVNWTVPSGTAISASETWKAIAFGDVSGVGTFVAVSFTGKVARSVDGGNNWVAATTQPTEANQWASVAYGNGRFVAVSADGTTRATVSTDGGVTWTMATAAPPTDAWRGITYGNGQFVAVSFDASVNRVMNSSDGNTWTAQNVGTASGWWAITYGAAGFVAVAAGGSPRSMTSTTGLAGSWTTTSAPTTGTWQAVTYANSQYVAVATGGSGNLTMQSADGVTWTQQPAVEANTWQSVAGGGGVFAAVSSDGTTRAMVGTTPTAPSPGPALGTQTISGNGAKPPKRIPRKGKCVLIKRATYTVQGQRVDVDVDGWLRGDTRLYRVIRKKSGKVVLQTYGQKLRIRLEYTAPATPGYSAYEAVYRYKT